MRSLLSAEMIRAKRSSLASLPLVAVVLVALTLLLRGYADEREDVTSVLNWLGFYLTGLAAPVAALFAASAEMRETQSNYGGTLWLPVGRTGQRAARLVAVLLSLLAFHLIYFGGAWISAVAAGSSGHLRILLLGFFAFLGAIGVAGLGAAVARITGLVVAVGAFLVWQSLGILRGVVEGAYWWAWPMAWPVRLILPVAGVHQNLIPLEADSPLRGESPWLALGLCVLLGIAGCAAAIMTPERTGQRRRGQATVVFAAEPSLGYVPAVAARGDGVPWRAVVAMTCAALTPGLLTCVALSALVLAYAVVVYSASVVHGLFAYAVLPLGAGLLPVFVWTAIYQAWPLMRVHYRRAPRLALLWSLLVLSVVSLTAAIAGLVAGGHLIDEARRLLTAILAGYILMLAAYLVIVRVGVAISLAVTLMVTIVSLLIGGDTLAGTILWLPALPAWPETTTNAPRLITALICGAILAAVLHVRAERTLSRTN